MRNSADTSWPVLVKATLRGVCVALVAAVVAGCGITPGSGPTKAELIWQNDSPNGQFLPIELTHDVVRVLQGRPIPSFMSTFGDFRPSPDQRIGVGDSIVVTIWEAAAGGLFSAPSIERFSPGSRSAVIPEQVVTRDGAITIPYAGRVRVVGLRTSDVERDIVARLEGKAIQPQALVTIARNNSNTVTVSGEATVGAVVPLNVRGNRLLEVVALAGGVRTPAHETFVVLNRSQRSVQVALTTVIGSPNENIYVRPGDVINVVRAPLTFTAIGATGSNAVVPFGAVTLTLEEALARAGGLLDYRADPDGVFVLRYEPVMLVRRILKDPNALPGVSGAVPVVYRVNMRDANAFFQARLFPVLDKDIIYVANAPMVEVIKAFTLINAAANAASAVRAATY